MKTLNFEGSENQGAYIMNNMGSKTLIFAVCLFTNIFFLSAFGQTQSNCPNSNFNLGNFTGWEGYYGDFWNPSIYKGFASTRHTIIRAPAILDPNTCNELNPVPTGEEYSLRLGNEGVGAEAEQIRYSNLKSSQVFLLKLPIYLGI